MCLAMFSPTFILGKICSFRPRSEGADLAAPTSLGYDPPNYTQSQIQHISQAVQVLGEELWVKIYEAVLVTIKAFDMLVEAVEQYAVVAINSFEEQFPGVVP